MTQTDMAIVGDRPRHGVRVILDRAVARAGGDGPPWIYAGHVHLPDRDHAVAARVSADGAVEVEVEGGAPREIAERVRRIVRSVTRDLDGAPPPRRIARWRAEK